MDIKKDIFAESTLSNPKNLAAVIAIPDLLTPGINAKICRDPIKIAEVVRDLFRKTSQAEQSYSERQMFQVAIERLAREVAAVEKTDYFQSTEKIETTLRNK